MQEETNLSDLELARFHLQKKIDWRKFPHKNETRASDAHKSVRGVWDDDWIGWSISIYFVNEISDSAGNPKRTLMISKVMNANYVTARKL